MQYKIIKRMHNLHNYFPQAPAKMIIGNTFKLSPYCKNIIDKFKEEYNIRLSKSKVPILVLSITNKNVMLFTQNY